MLLLQMLLPRGWICGEIIESPIIILAGTKNHFLEQSFENKT
jgi:hypothetical protein